MKLRTELAGIWLAMVVATIGCAQPNPATQPGAPQPSPEMGRASPLRTKHINAALLGQPTNFVARVAATQISWPGAYNLEQLVNASMIELDGEGRVRAQLAESAPTLENGLWRTFPDGRMETSWKIRPGSAWHDGVLLTGEDLVFALNMGRDPEVPTIRPLWYPWVESVSAVDPQTVTLSWNRPYIDADRAFSSRYVTPLPRHLLEEGYSSDRTRFLALPFWNQEFVGTGPFKVREFVLGSSLMLEANDRFVLGRPKIDEIEVRFVLELNALMSSLLAGASDLVIGRSFAVEQALQLRDQWTAGVLEYAERGWTVVYPQMTDPNPRLIADVRFRRAMLHATDRQELVDSIMGGLGGIADGYLPPSAREYPAMLSSVVRYPYDPRQATEIIERLGYTKGPDGTYRGGGGDRLPVELRSTGDPGPDKAIFAVADAWSRLGVATEPYLVPPQRAADREYGATFPGFRMIRQPNEASDLVRFHSSAAPLPENRFVGNNFARYVNPEFDVMLDRFLATISYEPRMEALKPVIHHLSEQLNVMGIWYELDMQFRSKRIQNLHATNSLYWGIPEWDLAS